MPKDIENPLKILSAEKIHEVKMYRRAVGDPVKVDETGIVRAVKVIIDDEGNETYQNLSYSKIPEGVRQALIILVPSPKDSTGLRFRSKVIDLSKFKKGGFLYVNLTSAQLGITLGEKKTVIQSGKMEFVNALGNQQKAVMPVQYYYKLKHPGEQKWQLMVSSKMAIFDSRREICVFYYNERIKNVDFRGIPFMTPPPKKQSR